MPIDRPIAEEPFDYGTPTAVGFQTIEERLREDRFDTVVINITTLVRNRSRKGIRVDQVVAEALMDLEKGMFTAATELAKKRGGYMLVYLPQYTRYVDKEFRRKSTSPVRLMVAEACSRMHRELTTMASKWDTTRMTYGMLGLRSEAPYRELYRLVSTLPNTHRVMHISHLPADFHLSALVADWLLVQTHTGVALTKNELPNKVFGNPDVPFIEATHALLGDKETIVGQLGRTVKRNFLTVAKDEHWVYHSWRYVVDRLRHHGFIVSGKTYPLIGRM